MAHTLNTVSCTIMDKAKQTSISTLDISLGLLDKALGLSKQDNLKKLIEDHSYAKVIKSSQALSYIFDMPEAGFFDMLKTSKKGVDLVDQKAVYIFRRKKNGKSFRWTIPAPHEGDFEYVREKGLRIKESVGDDVAKKLGTTIGEEIQFIRGYHTGKR